jgi:hypothetical protein
MEFYLQQIMKNTHDIMERVNTLPKYIDESLKFIYNWSNEDNTATSKERVKSFVDYSGANDTIKSAQDKIQTRILDDYFKGTPADYNSLAYPLLQGLTYTPRSDDEKKNDPNIPAYNYVKFASGLTLSHPSPYATTNAWLGSDASKRNYTNYYNTITAVQTFDSYVLSQLYADSVSGNSLTKSQTDLIAKASDPTWFTQIQSEMLGVVLRQLLMYSSQSYVILVQLLQTEKQQLNAQVMTNTLLISGSMITEKELYRRASQPPQPGDS